LGDYNIRPQVHYFNELPRVYNASAINLNISRTQLVTAVNQRVFDVPACRSFLLTDFKEELEEYFEIGKEIICYKGQEDLDRLVCFYLNNPSHRRRVSLSGYERVMAEHTYTSRMKRLSDIYKGMPEYRTEFNETGETWEKAHLSIGQAYLKLSNKDKAVFHFNKSLNRGSGIYINNLNSAGVSLLHDKQYLDCIPLFKEASEIDPDEPSFLSNIGLCYQNTGRYEKAEDYYKRALEKDPSYAIANANLENLYKLIKDKPNSNHKYPDHLGISLCMIVKNEADNLPRCLNAVKSMISELIIVDTGSTDRTVEVAKQYNAKIHSIKWNDNFSDARNASIELAEQDWILILDADEVLAEEDIETLKNMCNSKEYDAFSFITRNYTNDSSGAIWVPNDNYYKEGAGYAGWFPSRKVRLFKNDRRIRFSGVIHELVEHSIRKCNLNIGEAEISIHHYGASKPEILLKDKKIRYMDYCRKKIKEEPDNPKAFYEYGILCSESGLHEDAVRNFKKVLELNRDFPIVDGLLGASLISLGYFRDAIMHLKKGLVKEPDNPGLHNNLASAYYELGEYEKAVGFYKKAIEINPDYVSSHKNLGLVYLKSGKIDKAVEAFENALSLNPGLKDISRLLYEIKNIIPPKKPLNTDNRNHIKKNKLSLCMIVKDEEAVLKLSLESVAGIADEIIIVDTGSKDNTCMIASSFKAKIIYSPWEDDFSGPRNISIKNATGDYILWLDADEYISQESRGIFLNLKHNFPEDKKDAYSVIITSKRNDSEEESFRRLRIFPNFPGIKFKGRVHEDITESINNAGIKITKADIVVTHIGYKDDKEVSLKVKRNIPMLIKEHEETPEDPLISFYLANSFYCLGDMSNAIKYMEKVTLCRDRLIVNNEWYPFAFIKLAQFYRESGKQDNALGVYSELFRIFPDFPIGHFFYGEALFFQGKHKEALQEFKTILKHEIDAGEFPLPLMQIKYLKYYYSGCCFIELGEYSGAAECFSNAMEINPDALTLHISASRLFAVSGDIQSCVEACNKVLRDINMKIDKGINTIKDLSIIFDSIGSSLEAMYLSHEAMEAYKTALALTDNIQLQIR
ncbi:MAG: tetratricopeptide repeat protein, partial [Nitrospira sp.]|nr:tetratricopeptide repeat protein [Nitrospira sp.]